MSKTEKEEEQNSGLNLEATRKKLNQYERKFKFFKLEYGKINLNKTEESIHNSEKNDSFDFYELTNKNNYYKKKDKINILNILKKEENKKKKKVKFMEPIFVDIIEIESFKKFNEENTHKDPFTYYMGNNEDKENVLCSCYIF